MAYLKIFPIKVTDKKTLDYITNPDKTDEKLLVSSFGCSPETADLEFSMTREMEKKNGMDKGDNNLCIFCFVCTYTSDRLLSTPCCTLASNCGIRFRNTKNCPHIIHIHIHFFLHYTHIALSSFKYCSTCSRP